MSVLWRMKLMNGMQEQSVDKMNFRRVDACVFLHYEVSAFSIKMEVLSAFVNQQLIINIPEDSLGDSFYSTVYTEFFLLSFALSILSLLCGIL